MDSSKDINDIRETFINDAEAVYVEFRNLVVKDMKEDPVTTSGGGDSSRFSTRTCQVAGICW